MTAVSERVTKGRDCAPRIAVQRHCIDCCGGSLTRARECHITNCDLWPWRPGTPAWRTTKLTEEQKQAAAERLHKARARKKATTQVRTPRKTAQG